MVMVGPTAFCFLGLILLLEWPPRISRPRGIGLFISRHFLNLRANGTEKLAGAVAKLRVLVLVVWEDVPKMRYGMVVECARSCEEHG